MSIKNYIAKNKMINDIVDFLPKYPNINNFQNEMLNTYTDFYRSIFLKKEFNDLSLEKIEALPEKKGDLFKHQKLIARFLSSHTLYDQMLLVHDMGTGKTCSAVAVVEQIRKEANNFKGALYLAKGTALINNFIDELIFKCTDGKYIPDNFSSLTELEKVHREKKMINDFYNWGTFEIFTKEITRSSDEEIIKKYSNHIIIIDEIHNIRIQKKDNDKIKLYKQFWRFLHLVKDCKILLLSGTPMKDGIEEIASVMNLILPVEKQLPVQEDFIEDFFIEKSEDLYEIKEDMKNRLYDLFKGRVSYLRAMYSDVKRIYEGEKLGPLQYFNVYPGIMSEFQGKNYLQALLLDKEDRKGIYTKSRQASLFVFPDGSYGDEGYKKYIIQSGGKQKLGKSTTKSFKLNDSLINEIKAPTHEEMLKKLYKFSSKYAQSIQKILQSHEQGKLVFVYNEYVQGSGLILFGKLLELFSFSKATGKEEHNSEKPRYASLTNMTATNKQLKELVDRYNQPDNMNGKIISVIMGSRKISEGFSLKNVQVEDIQTPWFNYSETSQAIARGIRVGSHNDLIKRGQNVEIEIYQRVSLPTNGPKDSIDLLMYEISEKKDISIKSVMRIIKEAAWDCALTYKRNYIDGEDGSPECDYKECDYQCVGVPKDLIYSSKDELDISTYQLYYSDTVKIITKDLQQVFLNKFSLFYDEIEFMFSDRFSDFEILSSLQKITNENISFTNMYGFTSYLREDNNKYFLIDSLSVKGNYLSEFYTKYPTISNNKSFMESFEPIYYQELPQIIRKLCNSSTIEEVSTILNILPKELLEMILESSLIAQNKNVNKNIIARGLILEYFKGNYAEIDGVMVSWYLYSDFQIIRCLKGNEFEECNDYEEKVEKYLSSLQKSLEQNPKQVYGLINKTSDDFCIRDVREEISEKGNKVKTGKRCTNWKLNQLNELIIYHLKLPIPKEMLNTQETKLVDEISSQLENAGDDEKEVKNVAKRIKQKFKTKLEKDFKQIKENTDFLKLDKKDLLRVTFWMTTKLNRKCELLRSWFENNNLIQYDDECGKHGKLKKK
jgi:hypothetical protein